MILERIAQWLREARDKLAPMSGRKKWDYIWMYYHWRILGSVVAVPI